MGQPTNDKLMQHMMQILQRRQEFINTLAMSHGEGGLKVYGLKGQVTADEVKNLFDF